MDHRTTLLHEVGHRMVFRLITEGGVQISLSFALILLYVYTTLKYMYIELTVVSQPFHL